MPLARESLVLDAGNGKLELREYSDGSLTATQASVDATINADTANTVKVDRDTQGRVAKVLWDLGRRLPPAARLG